MEEAKKYKSVEEFIKKWSTKLSDWLEVPIELFFGKSKKVSFWNTGNMEWRNVDYYRKAVDYWKKRIIDWERPKISIVKSSQPWGYEVYDWNHRLQAYKEVYKELWIKNIPMAEYSPLKLAKDQLNNIYEQSKK